MSTPRLAPDDERAVAGAADAIHRARELERRERLERSDFHARIAESRMNMSTKMRRYLRRHGCRA